MVFLKEIHFIMKIMSVQILLKEETHKRRNVIKTFILERFFITTKINPTIPLLPVSEVIRLGRDLMSYMIGYWNQGIL